MTVSSSTIYNSIQACLRLCVFILEQIELDPLMSLREGLDSCIDEKVCLFCWLRKKHIGVYGLKIGESSRAYNLKIPFGRVFVLVFTALINSEKRKK